MWHYTICSKISNINKYWNSFHGLTSSPDIRSPTLENPSYLSSWLERAAHAPVDSDGQSRRSLSREPLRLTVACWDITMNQPSPMLWCRQNTKETLVLDKLPYGKKTFDTLWRKKSHRKRNYIRSILCFTLLCLYVPVAEVWQMCLNFPKLHFDLCFPSHTVEVIS